ncbi:hypothetical protein WG922_21425 [Ramlibacter sp. AN1015]|uniref:hypothetical protein n=1 Tax=Ramlibacter sp. AN1015 TaxID=3133428 RepID=UPI0030C60025
MSRATVSCLGPAFVVDFDYSPAEPAQHYGDAPYPGAPAHIEIECVMFEGEDFTDLLSATAYDRIEEYLLDSIEEGISPDDLRDRRMEAA